MRGTDCSTRTRSSEFYGSRFVNDMWNEASRRRGIYVGYSGNDRHPDFSWQPGRSGKGMVVTWAAHGCALSAAAAPSSASAAAAEWQADWGAVGGAAASAGGQQVEQQAVVLRRQALPRVWRQALPPL